MNLLDFHEMGMNIQF